MAARFDVDKKISKLNSNIVLIIYIMSDISSALQPVYTTVELNQDIVLYTGEMEIKTTFNNQSLEILGRGNVIYKWFPSPKLQVNLLVSQVQVPY
jgi:hypothetical protein